MSPPSIVSADHPREYGENLDLMPMTSISSGPSPRIRGKSAGLWYRPYHWGTIPANTGKMPASSPLNAETRDHPREYGENLSKTDEVAGKQGSSPRIRGKCCRRCSQRTLRADHPREYGENAAQPPPGSGRGGSSPRIRGKSLGGLPHQSSRGIIPANTGKIHRLTLTRGKP